MSWKDAAKRVLSLEGALVEEDQRGLVITPPDMEGVALIAVVRRLHMSLDRKIELLGSVEISRAALGSETLRKMLESSFEVEVKGIIRKRLVWRSWSGLKSLSKVLGSLKERKELIELIKSDEKIGRLIFAATPDLLEVFPEIMPSNYMEAYLLAPIAEAGSFIRELIKEYFKEPERLAWCFRMQFLYGSPTMPKKLRKCYRLALELCRNLREVTPSLFLYTSSSPREAESST